MSRERLGLIQTLSVADVQPEERASLPYLHFAVIPYLALDNGLPAGEEFHRVSRVEDKIMSALEAGGSIYLGHVTSGGVMTVVFHGPEQAPATVEVKTGLLKKESIPIETRHDPDWKWFVEHMEASPLEREIDQNREHLRQLTSLGDIPSKEREVDFFLDDVPSTVIGDIVKLMDAHGFKIASLTPPDSSSPRIGVHLTKDMAVEQETIAEVCVFMRSEATKFGAVFDGWGCSVAK